MRASRIEHFILENEQIKANKVGRDPHLISIIDNDGSIDIIDFLNEQSSEVITAKILKEKSYLCPVLRSSKGKEFV